MEKRFSFTLFIFSILITAQVGIGTSNPDTSSILDIQSTEKGILIPRMTTAERDLIANPASGLMIFNIDNGAFQYYSNGNWQQFSTAVDCFFSAFPSEYNENLDLGEQTTRIINFNYTTGTPGNVTTSLIFATDGFVINVDNITNNGVDSPVSQDIQFTLDNTSTAQVGDVGQAIFRVRSDCGAEQFITFNITVTGCDFTITPETNEVFVTIPAGGSEQVEVDYLIEQTGNIAGNISSVTVNEDFSAFGFRNVQFQNVPCAYSCTPAFRFQVRDFAQPGIYTYTLNFTSDCGFTDSTTLTVHVEETPRNCKQILSENTSSSSGVYAIDVDGSGGLSPFDAYCDMTTDGGGWTLVLNYYHQTNTDPADQPRGSNLPQFNATSALGDDQSNTIYWGHATNALLNMFEFTEVRFYGESSSHPRVLHFKHNQQAMIDYFKSGTGGLDITDLRNNFTPLTGHSSNLPFNANGRATNQENNAMLNRPFGGNGSDWRIDVGNDWEMDDNPNNQVNSTIHQVWIR